MKVFDFSYVLTAGISLVRIIYIDVRAGHKLVNEHGTSYEVQGLTTNLGPELLEEQSEVVVTGKFIGKEVEWVK